MKQLNQTQLIKEAAQQQEALQRLRKWLRNVMLVSSCAAVLAWWGLRGEEVRFAFGIGGLVFVGLSVLCAVVLGLGIRNGQRNIEHILQAAEKQKEMYA